MKNKMLVLIFAGIAVFSVLSGSADATISSDILVMAEVKKEVATLKYQAEQEAIIMSSLDKDSLAAKATIDGVRRDVIERQRVDGFFQKAVRPVIDAVLTAVRTVANGERLVKKTFDNASKLAAQDPETATEIVKKIIKFIRHFIYTSGIGIEDTFGAALALSGGANHKEMKASMDAIQSAGNSILDSLVIAEQIATRGIEAGGSAIGEGLNAAFEAFSTGCTASFEFYHKSAQYSLGAYDDASSVVIKRENRVNGIIKSLTSDVSTDNPAGLAAIASLEGGLQSRLNVGFSSKNASDAAKIMTQALISTILETSDAVSIAKKALEEAGKIANLDKEAAINAIQKAIKTAREEVLRGTTIGFLGFGAARHIAGEGVKIDGLIPAMVEVIVGRVAAYDDFKLALDIALIGIRGGTPLAIAQGISAAQRICEAAGSSLNIQYVESGLMGLDVFQKN